MPVQLPSYHQEDGISDFLSWPKGCKANSLPVVSLPEELDWFGNRYASAATSSYRVQNFLCNPDIASVIAVFMFPADTDLIAGPLVPCIGV